MNALDLEAVHEGVDLLIEELHAMSSAASRRHAQLRLGSRHQLGMVLRVEESARRLRAGLAAVGSGERMARLVEAVTAAAEFDAEFPDGGALLSTEHGEARQMTRALVAHLVGEYSFCFLATESAAAFHEEAQVVINTICGLHLDDWRLLAASEAA